MYAPTGDIETIPVGSVSVRLYAENDRIVVHQRERGGFEPETLRCWSDLCGAGGTMIDVGSYTGIFAIAAALSGCRAIAFEPLPENAARIRANAALNGVEVELVEAAISDRSGSVELSYSANVPQTSGASIVPRSIWKQVFGRNKTRISVPTMTLDSLALEQVTAIKIDVEKAEALVLRGGRTTLEKARPALLTEILDDAARADLLSLIPGYRVSRQLDRRNYLLSA